MRSLTEAIDIKIEKALWELSTCTFGKVAAIRQGSEENPRSTVDVIPMIMEMDEDGEHYPSAKVFNCPVIIPGSKELNISVDVQIGDVGMLLYMNTELGTWNKTRIDDVRASSYSNVPTSAVFIPISLGQYAGNALSIEANKKLILLSNENTSLKAEMDKLHDSVDKLAGVFVKVLQALIPQPQVAGASVSSYVAEIVDVQKDVFKNKGTLAQLLTDTYEAPTGGGGTEPTAPDKPTEKDNVLLQVLNLVNDVLTDMAAGTTGAMGPSAFTNTATITTALAQIVAKLKLM
jgi:hypothetical protein